MKITALRAAQLSELYDRLENIDGLLECLKVKNAKWSLEAFSDNDELGIVDLSAKLVRPVLAELRAVTVVDINRLDGVAK